MSSSNNRFPAKPINKKSLFERQRAEAEAKRQREAAETAAIYKDFVKSFGDDSVDDRGDSVTGSSNSPDSRNQSQTPNRTGSSNNSNSRPAFHRPSAGPGGRRHFSIPASGPSSLRNSGGPLGGPSGGGFGSSVHRHREGGGGGGGGTAAAGKRLAFGGDSSDEEEAAAPGRRGGSAILGGSHAGGRVPTAVERAEEKAISKPTMRLANLPPAISPAAIKALLVPCHGIAIDNVRILPSPSPSSNSTERKAAAAIVTLTAETAASDIDAAVSALQNRYLGYGYYLTLHRHLSSAVVSSSSSLAAASVPVSASSLSSSSAVGALPFGAKPVSVNQLHGAGAVAPPALAGGRFPPPGFGRGGNDRGGSRGIPPPSSFSSSVSHDGVGGKNILYVPIRPPRNIKKLRMIHKTIERVLDHGPAFEALLMSRPEVQREEKWAWLWDARSEAGVWYRYRLWEIVSGHQSKRGQGKYVPLFEGQAAWKVPDHPLPYEFTTSVSEFVSDSEYNSSDDSDYDDGPSSSNNNNNNNSSNNNNNNNSSNNNSNSNSQNPHHVHSSNNNNSVKGADADGEDMFLNPLEKAKLTHLLARLPTTLGRLRRGDIARVTAFAITHASRGADEIVDMIVSNIEQPFALTAANPHFLKDKEGEREKSDKADQEEKAEKAEKDKEEDSSAAKLIAVYVASDILGSSATSGIRHAWRYRQLFESALRRRNVFAGLGQLADRLHWGRMRAEKWKRSIGLVLGYWEGWSVFSSETQEHLVQTFENPPRKEEATPALAGGGSGGSGGSGGGSAAAAAAATSTGVTAVTATSAPKKSRWKTVDKVAEPAGSRGFRPVEASTGDGDAMDVDEQPQAEEENGEGEDHDAVSDEDGAYRSEYTDDEAVDVACLDVEDIDGEPMSEADWQSLDGIPLTAEEIEWLGGDIAEMSEEGEIGSDDDEYDVSGLSEMSDLEMDMEKSATRVAETERETAPPAQGQRNLLPETKPAPKTETKTETKSVGGFQMSASSVGNTSRKRIRAVDMFADSDAEDES